MFLANILFLSKTYVSSWLNFSLFFIKLFSHGKTYISSWLNFSLLAKPISNFG
jgi:hypothetical protein